MTHYRNTKQLDSVVRELRKCYWEKNLNVLGVTLSPRAPWSDAPNTNTNFLTELTNHFI